MKEDEQNRLYSEKEIAALFRRASELQNAETAGTAPGLSFSEVERIARDLGIDPRYVEAAAMDLRAGGSPAEKRSLIGAPVLIEGGRLASKDVSDEQWESMVQECRRAFGQTGRTEQRGRTMEWMTSGPDLVENRMTVTPKGDATSIQLSQDYSGVAGLAYITGTLATVVSAAALVAAIDLPLAAEVAAGGGTVGGALLLLRTWFRHFMGGQRRKQTELLGRLQSIAGIAQPQQHAVTAADQGMELSDGSEYGVMEETQRQRQREYDAE
jgi:hypothetical protein